MITLETAKNYFNNHLLRAVFFESGSEQMSAAVAMAENDIRALLRVPADESSASYIAAVCEQALFLLTRQERLVEDRILISETVEGMGSRQYSAPDRREKQLIAPRAEIFIADLNSSASVNILRG